MQNFPVAIINGGYMFRLQIANISLYVSDL